MSYLWRGNVFTGDALLIDGCGRTDFQGGDAGALYDSIHARLFTLPEITRVFPGHDYKGNSVSTIGWEKRHNARLANRDRAGFIELMGNLKLPRPKMMDIFVPANRRLGSRMPPDEAANGDADSSTILARAEARAKALGVPFRGSLLPAETWALFSKGEIELIDTRTLAERDLVGYVPGSLLIEWYDYPAKKRNPNLHR